MPNLRREVRLLVSVGALCFLLAAGCGEDPQVTADNAFYQAQDAASGGDKEQAVALLTQAIETTPRAYMYYERARLHLDLGKDEQAVADCEAGLQLDPEDKDLIWLMDETQKKPQARFRGRNAQPPRERK